MIIIIFFMQDLCQRTRISTSTLLHYSYKKISISVYITFLLIHYRLIHSLMLTSVCAPKILCKKLCHISTVNLKSHISGMGQMLS